MNAFNTAFQIGVIASGAACIFGFAVFLLAVTKGYLERREMEKRVQHWRANRGRAKILVVGNPLQPGQSPDGSWVFEMGDKPVALFERDPLTNEFIVCGYSYAELNEIAARPEEFVES